MIFLHKMLFYLRSDLFSYDFSELLQRCKFYALNRPQNFKQFFRPLFPDTFDEIELGLQCSLLAQNSMIRDRKPVSLIPDLLEELETGRRFRDGLRVARPGHEDFLKTFCKPDHRD